MIRLNSAPALLTSEITTSDRYHGRRDFLKQIAALAGSATLGSQANIAQAETSPWPQSPRISPLSLSDEKPTSMQRVTSYGNFYEFGPDKDSPAKHAGSLRIAPWSIRVEGEVKSPRSFAFEDLLKWGALEERVYRFRCVEGWSAVIPWVGLPFAELITTFCFPQSPNRIRRSRPLVVSSKTFCQRDPPASPERMWTFSSSCQASSRSS